MARLTIIGTGLIGTSIGLALHQASVKFEIVGHDRDFGRAGAAKKSGAVDRTEWNLPAALEGAALVIIATPLTAIETLMGHMAPNLTPGCIVMDTASLKGPVLGWAEAQLTRQVPFVGGNPIVDVVGTSTRPTADLFRDRTFCVTPASWTEPSSVDQITRLVEALGANPLFLDPVEHDSHVAAVGQLPSVLAATLIKAVTDNPAWRDGQRLAGALFGAATSLAARDPAEQQMLWQLNQAELTRWLDLVGEELAEIRRHLAEDPDALGRTLALTQQRRLTLRLGEEIAPETLPEPPGARETLMGSWLWGRRGGRGEKKR